MADTPTRIAAAESTDPPARETLEAVDVGLSVPLRIDAGAAALIVGDLDPSLPRALASHGAVVTVLEADPSTARQAGERSVHTDDVTVVGTRLDAWLEDGAPAGGPFDLVFFADRDAGAAAASTATLDEVLAAATELLRADGVLVLVAQNAWGLRSALGGPERGPGHSAAALSARVSASGLEHQRWLLPYPTPEAAEVVLDAAVLETPRGADIARSVVRRPVPAAGSVPYLRSPRVAFGDALRAGLAAAVADHWIILAGRTGQALSDGARDGQAWLLPERTLSPAWQRPRELLDVGGRRLWHPVGSYQERTSGPLALAPATIPVAVGRSGEDAVTEAVTEGGLGSAACRDTIATWFAAAASAMATSEAHRRPLDLRPRHFDIDAGGSWHYNVQDLMMRFATPTAALAFGALAWTLREAVLPEAALAGIAPTATVGEAARSLLEDAGVECGVGEVYVWTELAADLRVRTGDGVDRDAARAETQADLDRPLLGWLPYLPVEQVLIAGARVPELSARVSQLERELVRSRGAAASLRAELERARAGTDSPETAAQPSTAASGGDPLPTFADDDDYLRGVMRLEPWEAALDEVLAREGITPAGAVRVASRSKYAAFFVPPDHYVKIYLKRLAGHERHAAESAALQRLARDPELPVPRLVGDGRIGDRARYLVTSRVPGHHLADVRGSLDEPTRTGIVAWAGRFLRRLWHIPLEAEERAAAWDDFRGHVSQLRGTVVPALRSQGRLPAGLIDEVGSWLPPADAFHGRPEDMTVVHGDFELRNVMVDIEGDGFAATGVIGFGSSRIGHPMWDFARAWGDVRAEGEAVAAAFLQAAPFPGVGERDFARSVLAWTLLQRWERVLDVPDIESVASLDELAERIMGRDRARRDDASGGR